MNPNETQKQPVSSPQPPVTQAVGQTPIATPQKEVKRLAGLALPPMLEKLMPLILAVLAIGLGIIIFAVVQQFIEKPVNTPVTIIVTPTPNPTPVRIVTAIASTSAFTTFERDIASLSASVEQFEVTDPSLSPPSLVLPLGFPNSP